jgi:hypothetical protein
MKLLSLAFMLLILVVFSCRKEDAPPSQSLSTVTVEAASSVKPIIIYADERSVKIALTAEWHNMRVAQRFADSIIGLAVRKAAAAGKTINVDKWRWGNKWTTDEFEVAVKEIGFANSSAFYIWQNKFKVPMDALKANFPNLHDSELRKATILTNGDPDPSLSGPCESARSGCNATVEGTFATTASQCVGAAILASAMSTPAGGAAVFAFCSAGAIYQDAKGHQACDHAYDECKTKNPGLMVANKYPKILEIGDLQWKLITPVRGRCGGCIPL